MSIVSRFLTSHVLLLTSHVSRPTYYVLISLLTLHSSLLTPHSFSQDHPTGNPPLLPFQQNAPMKENDEQLAMQLYQERDFEKAAEVFERLYEKKPTSFYYTYLLYSLIEIREFNKAEKLIRQQQRNAPSSLRYIVDLGYVYFREGNPEKSKKHYEEALKKLGADRSQIVELANAFLVRGENDYAISAYMKGRELMKNPYLFSFELAAIYEREGEYRNAFNEYLNLLSVDKNYRNTVEDRLQNLLADDKDNEKSEILRTTLLGRVQKEPEKTYYSELLWWYSLQQKDFELAFQQARSLDRRLKENGERILQVAALAISNDNFDVALEAYQYIISKGPDYPFFETGRVEIINTRYLKAISRPSPEQKTLNELQQEFIGELRKSGENPQTLSLMKNLAHLEAFYLDKPGDAIELLGRTVHMGDLTPSERARCKMELADILLFTGDVWEATLLYQQVYQDYKNDVMGQEAKFKNARLTYYIGEFEWARTQLDILKAATSKLIANDAMALSLLISENMDPDSGTVALGIYARAELLDFRNEEAAAIRALDSIPALFPGHPILDEVLYKKASIRRKEGRYQETDSLLAILIADYPDGILTDEALMDRGELNDYHLNDKQKAMSYYQELMEKFPGSVFVTEARKRFRFLRGDKTN